MYLKTKTSSYDKKIFLTKKVFLIFRNAPILRPITYIKVKFLRENVFQPDKFSSIEKNLLPFVDLRICFSVYSSAYRKLSC